MTRFCHPGKDLGSYKSCLPFENDGKYGHTTHSPENIILSCFGKKKITLEITNPVIASNNQMIIVQDTTLPVCITFFLSLESCL